MMRKAEPALKGIADRLEGKMRNLNNENAILTVCCPCYLLKLVLFTLD